MDTTTASTPPRRKLLISRFHLFPIGVLVAVTATAMVKIKAEHGLPVHWGFDGKPDQFWPRDVALAVAPSVAVLLLALFALLGRFLPTDQIEPGRRMWEWLLTFLLGLLCAVQFAFILIGVGSDIDLIRFIAALVALVLVVLGAQLVRVPPNVYRGLRLPWTLPTPAAWIAAHRASGGLAIVAGLALAHVVWFEPTPANLLLGVAVAILVTLLGSAAVSLFRARG